MKSYVLLAACGLAVPAVSFAAPYSDNFDVNTSAAYTVNQDPDTTVQFSYDYSADGIPSAPNSVGGTTRGVKFTANNGDATATAAAINISPTGGSFGSNVTVRFDMWINVNGPHPAGGTGSTEYLTGGVGTAGGSVQKSTVGADGAWFAVDGEGGSSQDFRAYRLATLQTPSSGAYAAGISTTTPEARDSANTYYHATFPGGQEAPASQGQTGALRIGAVGFAWREVEIVRTGNDVTWSIDGLEIATLTNATLAGDNIFVGYWDIFSSISDNPAQSFGVVDNLVVAVPEPTGIAALGLAGLGFLARRRRA